MTNKWTKLQPLLDDINKTLNHINRFNKNNKCQLAIKNLSLEMPCFIKNSGDSIEVNLPDPDSKSNPLSMSKFKLDCNVLPTDILFQSNEPEKINIQEEFTDEEVNNQRVIINNYVSETNFNKEYEDTNISYYTHDNYSYQTKITPLDDF